MRRIAEQLDLITAKKKDSTGICFIGERKFKDFLAKFARPARPHRNRRWQVIGEHQGLMYHTLGQRKGLGIGGRKDATEEAWYVVDKEVERNVLVVAQGEHPVSTRWPDREPIALGGSHPIRAPRRCTVKTRYRQEDIPCLIQPIDDEAIRVIFDEKQAAVTPGQSAVFYDGEVSGRRHHRTTFQPSGLRAGALTSVRCTPSPSREKGWG